MRIPLIALLSGVLVSTLLAGTAGAEISGGRLAPVPTGQAALTANPIYKTGKLEPDACPEQPVYNDDRESAEIYLDFALDCLNEGWEYQFAKVKLPFSKPRFAVTSRIGVPTGCGKFPKDAQAVYCPANKKITFYLNKDILSQATELFLLQTLAHEYGHHVQQLSGIMTAFASRDYKNEKAVLRELRKIELQAECLSGAFIGSIWHSLNREESDFKYVLSAAYSTATHGTAKNVAYWVTRGFDQETPGSCNTFSAPRSKVA
ncbi:neutral zinc metallopeptidase [Streptosporangium sp. NPDC000563]|uniref:neutral zinc metallopeptidase n=1 Tax=unclassified Streptosporangium TaxID=2632669 RepID=UPI0033296961